MKKIKKGQGYDWEVREGLYAEETSKWRPKGKEEPSHEKIGVFQIGKTPNIKALRGRNKLSA